ncbi:hypothetical protein [Sinorhizobium sp. P24N7]|uniref:hypothetical protein n=1 Tax=Sinorhizobium sp. P24N7 TaxID=3348358 RepID=UPI0036D3B2C9
MLVFDSGSVRFKGTSSGINVTPLQLSNKLGSKTFRRERQLSRASQDKSALARTHLRRHEKSSKACGYRWSDGDGRPKSWWIAIDEEQRAAELAFLKSEINGKRRPTPKKADNV